MNSKSTKDFKAKKVLRRNTSKDTSKPSTGGISRTKKASPALLEMVKRANKALSVDELNKIYDEDELLKDLSARKEHEAYRGRLDEMQAELSVLYEDIRVRYLLLNIIELAKQGEISYLRQCAECGNIFFAGRKDQRGCSPACLSKIRKRRWRKHYAEAKDGERRGYLKTKRAKTASKR